MYQISILSLQGSIAFNSKQDLQLIPCFCENENKMPHSLGKHSLRQNTQHREQSSRALSAQLYTDSCGINNTLQNKSSGRKLQGRLILWHESFIKDPPGVFLLSALASFACCLISSGSSPHGCKRALSITFSHNSIQSQEGICFDQGGKTFPKDPSENVPLFLISHNWVINLFLSQSLITG